ncbi:unnamed protein product [Phytophthora lilii]|uniref:Unnamed protein product n=1 Tax=Phytophthora lilii TaxID=2077276 RepID=A0A9W6U0X8_9STRA|nr:unnamed protein product [Phytophthora lilii]
MQVSVLLPFLAAAVATTTAADSFSAEEQAIWIDRHNYFRTTGLPWSAGDMRRIGWSADLATTAATTAAKCSASSAAGVNAFQSSSANSSSIIDEAIQQWVVETSVTTLKTLEQPGANGVDVGKGVYNSYSQVVWAATTSVGCATASCSGSEMVVCQYSPAGNDGSSPWYVHAEPASDCPSGTTASQGLCIVEGDAANEQIAAIPAGELTYEVYPSYVADIQTVLIEAARAIASGSTTPTGSMGSSKESTLEATTAPASKIAAPTATTAAPTATTATPTTSSSETSSQDSGSDTKTGATKNKATTTSSSSDSSSSSSSDYSTATKTGTKTDSSSSSDSSTAIKTGKKTDLSSSTDSSSESSAKQTSQTDESSPGKVKASSDSGSTFTNQQTSTTKGSSTEQTSGSTTTASAPSTNSAESTSATTSSDTATSINNKSSTSSGGGISAAGLAGMIVLAIVGVAAFGVVMSYKKNQQRQREIMRDGGIRVI